MLILTRAARFDFGNIMDPIGYLFLKIAQKTLLLGKLAETDNLLACRCMIL